MSIIGLPLSWQKGAAGYKLVWIGAEVAWTLAATVLSVPPAKITEIRDTLIRTRSMRVITVKAAQSLAGVLNFYAGIVPWIVPFLHCIWAAIAEASKRRGLHEPPSRTNSLVTFVVVKRFAHALTWLIAFFSESVRGLYRNAYTCRYSPISACTWQLMHQAGAVELSY